MGQEIFTIGSLVRQMLSNLPSEIVSDSGRRASRTNLYLAATLVDDSSQTAVTIRNLSSTGALIEARVAVGARSEVVIVRGSLRVSGKLVWIDGRRAGVRFDNSIDPVAWIPGARLSGQSNVDRMILESRAEIANATSTCRLPQEAASTASTLLDRIAEELDFAARKLSALGSNLADDTAVVMRHGALLQELDISTQVFGHLSRLLRSDSPRDLLQTIGMDDLRRRLERVSVFHTEQNAIFR